MDIFFCDVCCARVTGSHLSRGHGVRNGDVIICGSCLEKGHGAELLKEAATLETVAAAPRMAGSDALDDMRDRAQTMKNLDPVDGDDGQKYNDPIEDSTAAVEEPISDEAEEIASVESDALASDSEDGQIDLSAVGTRDKITQIPSEPELEEGSADLNVVDVEDVDDAEGSEQNAEDGLEDTLELEANEGEALPADPTADELNEEPDPGSSHISAEDAVDDLDDSGSHQVPDMDRLEDADDDVHTDSYSADELAAIRRLADKEKAKKSSSAKSSTVASGRKNTAKSGPRSSARSKTKSGRRASASSARRATSSAPKTSGRTKTASNKSSRKVSRKTSTRAKASKDKMPMPMLVSFITIPILVILFLIFMPEGNNNPVIEQVPDTTSDLTSAARRIRARGAEAYQSENLAELRAVKAEIHGLIEMRDRVTRKLEASGEWSLDQIDRATAECRKTIQQLRSISEKIIEIESRD